MRLLAFFLISVVARAADTVPARVEAFLRARAQAIATGEVNAADEKAILARPDPGTTFGHYVFGLRRNASKLLTEDQAKRLNAVIDAQGPDVVRWHDERNTLRCKFTEVMWRFIGASDTDAPKLRSELQNWMRLRVAWTEQEHLAQFRMARGAWDILTPEQRQCLVAGEWKEFAKQDTGHARADFTTTLLTRALGKPDNADAFEMAVAAWAKERVPLREAFVAADKRERCIVFAMDSNSEPMAHRANGIANAAFSTLCMAEADAFRRIVRAAYVNPAERCEKAAGVAWQEAARRFKDGAAELITLIADDSKPWRVLFDGATLKGWRTTAKSPHSKASGYQTAGNWRVENGIILGSQDTPGNGGLLITEEQFGDFEISLETNNDFGPDSGLFMRCTEDGKAYQCLIDYHKGGTIGGILGERIWKRRGVRNFTFGDSPDVITLNENPQPCPVTSEQWKTFWKPGQWNEIRARITSDPPTITTWANGVQIMQHTEPASVHPAKGHIGLQIHGGEKFTGTVRYRNIRIRVP